jgi:lipopolysaccharide export system protein LptA
MTKRLPTTALKHFGLSLAALAVATVLVAPAAAQTITNNSFGGFSKSSSSPIDIESDVLVVHDAKKYATFKGNVKAVQGTTTLRANELDVHYVGGGDAALTGEASPAAKTGGTAAGLGGAGAQINKIEARGNVSITSDKDQTTTSDWALYDVPTQIVTVGGNVVLMQGQNVLKGDQLVIDLKTGESRFENKGDTVTGGRIRALFMPKDAKPGDGTAEGGKSTDDKSDGDKDKAAKKAAKEEAKSNDEADQPAPGGNIFDPVDNGQ